MTPVPRKSEPMAANRAKYDFASSRVPSLAEVRETVARDRDFPSGRRASTLSSLSRLAKWSGRDAATIAFAAPIIEALFDRLRPDVLGISPKRLANARADVRYVLDRYGGRAALPRAVLARGDGAVGYARHQSTSGARWRACSAFCRHARSIRLVSTRRRPWRSLTP